MGPRATRGVANLAPNMKLGEVQQDANRFVKGGPIAPSKYCHLLKNITDQAQNPLDGGPRGRNCGCLGGPEGRISAPRACRVRCSPKGPKLGFEYLQTYKTLHCMRTACALRVHCVHGISLEESRALEAYRGGISRRGTRHLTSYTWSHGPSDTVGPLSGACCTSLPPNPPKPQTSRPPPSHIDISHPSSPPHPTSIPPPSHLQSTFSPPPAHLQFTSSHSQSPPVRLHLHSAVHRHPET